MNANDNLSDPLGRALPAEPTNQPPRLGVGWHLAAGVLAILGLFTGAVLGDAAYLAAVPRPTKMGQYQAVQFITAAVVGLGTLRVALALARSTRRRLAGLAGVTGFLFVLLGLGVILVQRQIDARVPDPLPEIEKFTIPDEMFSNKPSTSTVSRPTLK